MVAMPSSRSGPLVGEPGLARIDPFNVFDGIIINVRTPIDSWLYGDTVEPDVRFTLANERTFLAWIRTSLGFLAAALATDALEVGDSVELRKLLCLALGLLALAAAAHGWWSWACSERAIRRNQPLPRRRAPIPLVALASIATALGTALVLT